MISRMRHWDAGDMETRRLCCNYLHSRGIEVGFVAHNPLRFTADFGADDNLEDIKTDIESILRRKPEDASPYDPDNEGC